MNKMKITAGDQTCEIESSESILFQFSIDGKFYHKILSIKKVREKFDNGRGSIEVIDGVEYIDATPPKIPIDISEREYQEYCLSQGIDPNPWVS